MDGANGGLTLPQQVRAEWLADPVRAREWKSFLTRFDERYCQAAGAKIEGGTVTAVTTGAGAAADQRVPEMKIGKMEDLKDVCQSLAGPSGSTSCCTTSWSLSRSCGWPPLATMAAWTPGPHGATALALGLWKPKRKST